MSFEELFDNQFQQVPIHSAEHRLRPVTDKNTACDRCYPIPPTDKLPISFLNFAKWIYRNYSAYQFSGYTVSALKGFLGKLKKDPNHGPLSDNTTKAAYKVLLSNGYSNKPDSVPLLVIHLLNLPKRTNYFQQEVTPELFAQFNTELRTKRPDLFLKLRTSRASS